MTHDKGLGDTVKRVLDKVGVRQQGCGCASRQAILNRLIPYFNGPKLTPGTYKGH